MAAALAQARAAAARGEVPVGAALTDSAGVLIAAAGNRTRELQDPTAHAEMLVIRAAGRERLPGHTLTVTLEPCPMCAAAIGYARIARLVWGADDPKSGGVLHGPRVYDHAHHRPEIVTGIAAEDCAAVLRDFFGTRR